MGNKKTIREWFDELPEPQRTEAIENTNEDELDELILCLSDVIASAFVWGKTPQGHEYWFYICEEIKRKEGN